MRFAALTAEERPLHIDDEDAVEFFLADLHYWLGKHHPSVIHEDVQPAEFLEAGVEQPANFPDLAHASLLRYGLSTPLVR
jgi:hypothetical protein